MNIDLRPLADSGIQVSAVAFGAWPISGMSSVDVNDRDSLRTIAAALDVGVNFIDTAYGYGAGGESERLIGRALRGRRDEAVIATKCGLHWDARVQRVMDATPKRIRLEIDESLRRLDTDRVELLYLHATDGRTPLAETAGALLEIVQSGKARAIGVSNFNVEQLDEFTTVCPIAAHQPPYNMLALPEGLPPKSRSPAEAGSVPGRQSHPHPPARSRWQTKGRLKPANTARFRCIANHRPRHSPLGAGALL
jgi:aryl-alcohol dehydrogenase-like predicted oxidoreductase